MARYVFGADVGGTTAKIGLLSETGEKLDFWEIPTRTEDEGKNILPDIAEAIRKKMDFHRYSIHLNFWNNMF